MPIDSWSLQKICWNLLFEGLVVENQIGFAWFSLKKKEAGDSHGSLSLARIVMLKTRELMRQEGACACVCVFLLARPWASAVAHLSRQPLAAEGGRLANSSAAPLTPLTDSLSGTMAKEMVMPLSVIWRPS